SGDIRVGRLDYNIYTNNQFKIVQPMQDIVVRKSGPNGVPIHVRDIGSVEDSAEKQTAIVRGNGNRAVFLRVNKQPGANTVAVVDQVKELMPRLMGVPPASTSGSRSTSRSTSGRRSRASGTRRSRAPSSPSW